LKNRCWETACQLGKAGNEQLAALAFCLGGLDRDVTGIATFRYAAA
jgi:hypothetical protein